MIILFIFPTAEAQLYILVTYNIIDIHFIPYPGGEIKVALDPLRTTSIVGRGLVPIFSRRLWNSILLEELSFFRNLIRNREIGDLAICFEFIFWLGTILASTKATLQSEAEQKFL